MHLKAKAKRVARNGNILGLVGFTVFEILQKNSPGYGAPPCLLQCLEHDSMAASEIQSKNERNSEREKCYSSIQAGTFIERFDVWSPHPSISIGGFVN